MIAIMLLIRGISLLVFLFTLTAVTSSPSQYDGSLRSGKIGFPAIKCQSRPHLNELSITTFPNAFHLMYGYQSHSGNSLHSPNKRKERHKREISPRSPYQEEDKNAGFYYLYPESDRLEKIQKRDLQNPEISVPLSFDNAENDKELAHFLFKLMGLSAEETEPRWIENNQRRRLNDMSTLSLSNDGVKRNALSTFKRQKFKSHKTQFIPSISVGAMTNLGDFFDDLKTNVNIIERGNLPNAAEQLLEGEHPIANLHHDLVRGSDDRPSGTAAFLHAFRAYRPSQKIRSLVSMTPEGYHGSQFLDPNYYTIGLGK